MTGALEALHTVTQFVAVQEPDLPLFLLGPETNRDEVTQDLVEWLNAHSA
jgi:hypothetical protein